MSLISFPLNSIGEAFRRFRFRWRYAERAVSAERRRIARNLHDGLAQELAFISLESRRLTERGEAIAGDLAAAADRALYETRAAIELLREQTDRPLGEAVVQTATELTARSNVALELDVDPRAELPPERRESLLRILREAVSNGLRHGDATTIGVRLSGDSGVQLCVADNGAGFDTGSVAGDRHSFGLTSMTERAHELGGEINLRSRPGAGTSVEVSLP